ncbi:hypothetical protein LIER_10636 [Lithospermum erythrorhizon]|uniref:Uncharacterized protein n=1 Tax=Lithospermum erythrorhizon TaxID=34254 RepID=A0AAV3PMV6_LITER
MGRFVGIRLERKEMSKDVGKESIMSELELFSVNESCCPMWSMNMRGKKRRCKCRNRLRLEIPSRWILRRLWKS